MQQIVIRNICLFCLLPTLSIGQQIDLFALGEAASSQTVKGTAIVEYFIKLKAETAQDSILTTLPDLQTIAKGTSSFNYSTNEFIFWAKKQKAYQLYTLNTRNNQLIPNETLFDYPPLDVQYDMRHQTYFALRYIKSNTAKNKMGRPKKYLEVVNFDGHSVNIIAQLPDINAISIGATAFDSHRGLYIFAATDQQYQDRIYIFDISNQNLIDIPKIKGFYFYEFQFDVQDSKVYGLCRKKTNTEQFFFVEIDIYKARPIIIAPVHNLFELRTGTSAFEQKEGIYTFVGKDSNNQDRLYVLDALTGDVIYNTPLKIKAKTVVCNNSDFIQTYFKEHPVFQPPVFETKTEIGAEVLPTEDKPKIETIQLLSSAVTDTLKLDVKLPENTTYTVCIYNMTRKKVFEKLQFSRIEPEENVFDIAHLEAGIYLLEVKTAHSLYSKKIIKR